MLTPIQPTLIQGGKVLSTGKDYTIDGPLISAIAYLQTGDCGFNGENCTLIETTLENVAPGNAGSLTGVSLTPPHKFSVTSGFGYYYGCDGAGADCDHPGCPAASAPVSCKAENVNLAITFCD
ncbi:glycopeptide [Ganoderma leucocontextum]|nr:glycopeptide [Ganoderma leucocontextum]